MFCYVAQGHSRSLEMTPFSMAFVSPYQYSIVTMSLSHIICLFLRYLASNNNVTLKSGLGASKITGKSIIWYIAYEFFLVTIVTMALSCIVSEIKRDIGQKLWFFHIPPAFNTPKWNSRLFAMSSSQKKDLTKSAIDKAWHARTWFCMNDSTTHADPDNCCLD